MYCLIWRLKRNLRIKLRLCKFLIYYFSIAMTIFFIAMKMSLTQSLMIKTICATMMTNQKWTLHHRVLVKILNLKMVIKMMILISRVLQVGICNRYITISTSIHLLCIKYFYLIGTYQFGDDDTSVGNADDHWPTMQDLNTRLRRVITSYQRNYKREELKMQQKAKVFIFMQLKFYKNSMFCLSILME